MVLADYTGKKEKVHIQTSTTFSLPHPQQDHLHIKAHTFQFYSLLNHWRGIYNSYVTMSLPGLIPFNNDNK